MVRFSSRSDKRIKRFVSETSLETAELDLTTEMNQNTNKMIPEARNFLKTDVFDSDQRLPVVQVANLLFASSEIGPVIPASRAELTGFRLWLAFGTTNSSCFRFRRALNIE